METISKADRKEARRKKLREIGDIENSIIGSYIGSNFSHIPRSYNPLFIRVIRWQDKVLDTWEDPSTEKVRFDQMKELFKICKELDKIRLDVCETQDKGKPFGGQYIGFEAYYTRQTNNLERWNECLEKIKDITNNGIEWTNRRGWKKWLG